MADTQATEGLPIDNFEYGHLDARCNVNLYRKVQLLLHIARWRLRNWERYDARYVPEGLDPTKFVSANEAVAAIGDGAVVSSCGMAAHARSSIIYWTLRDQYAKTGHPKGLTWVTVGAQGGRGKVPGTLEELDAPGLVTRTVMGHHETCRSLLRRADAGGIELHTLPQGQMAFLIEGQAKGVFERTSTVGVGTFLDPRVGRGSAITPDAEWQLVEADGDSLRYRLPKLEVTVFNVPWADAQGNLYFRGASVLSEVYDSARAVHTNGGTVIACVAGIVDHDQDNIGIPAEWVDRIVVNPHNEQTASIPMHRYWPALTEEGVADPQAALADINFINRVLGITPKRRELDHVLARLAAQVIAAEVRPGDLINTGVGLPEETTDLLVNSDLGPHLTSTSEAGVLGGVLTAGMFFGGAVNPDRVGPTSSMFREYEQRLAVSCLGMLETDQQGNVNVSRRGEEPSAYVGPGGLPDICNSARTLVFVGSWMTKAKLRVEGAQVRIDEAGAPKFRDRVQEITFSASEALKAGKKVRYVTTVGVFDLTPDGLRLAMLMPGIDIERDILANTTAKLIIPEGDIPLVDESVVTGQGFRLTWAEGVAVG